MRDGGRYDDGGRRLESDHLGLERHLAAAAGDQQDLKQIAMAMRPDRPVVDGGARRDGFDVNEVERLIVRRIAVEVEQGQGGASRHGRSVAHFGGPMRQTLSLTTLPIPAYKHDRGRPVPDLREPTTVTQPAPIKTVLSPPPPLSSPLPP